MFITKRSIVKKVSVPIITSLMLFSSCISVSASYSGNIKGTNVNVRSKPTVNSTCVGSVSNQKVTVIGTSGDWSNIQYGDKKGWVKSNFITTASSSTNSSSKDGLLNGSNINIRSKPTTSAKVVASLSNKSVDVVGSSGEWYKISCDGIQGWVKDDFVVVYNKSSLPNRQLTSSTSKSQESKSSDSVKTGTIKGSNVNVRSKPTTTAKISASLSNAKVDILSQSGNWYKVSSGKVTGWVSKDFVAVSGTTTQTASLSPKAITLRNRIVLYSRGFLGTRYVYGGSTPSGFDCSGFTSYVYKNFGIDLNRASVDQAKQGVYTARNKLQPGDLVFFDTNGGSKKVVNHVGMYVGDGKFIHASSSTSGKVVKISSLNEDFYNKSYVTGRRILKS